MSGSLTKHKGACYRLYDQQDDTGSLRTFVTFGVPRGGTTMVAGILMQCGLDIGCDLPNNLEDPRFNLDLLNRLEEDPINSLIQSVTDRNSSSSGDWGWKYPRAVAYLDMLRDHLTNPHLILRQNHWQRQRTFGGDKQRGALAAEEYSAGKKLASTVTYCQL
jgi:hypothetical protein